jgi:hypothetical protein
MTGRWIIGCSFFFRDLDLVSWVRLREIDDQAQSVTAGCHEALKRTGQLHTFDAGLRLGILKGLHYLSKDI